jgi:hypothetical protein
MSFNNILFFAKKKLIHDSCKFNIVLCWPIYMMKIILNFIQSMEIEKLRQKLKEELFRAFFEIDIEYVNRG